MNYLKPGEVAKRMAVTVRTLEYWANDPTDDFPKPVLRKRKYYYVESEVEAYQKRQIAARDREQREIDSILEFGRKSA